MSTRQRYAGKGNFVPIPAKKGLPKARPIKKRLPLQSPQPTPSASSKKQPYVTKWQNSPLDCLSDLLAIKQRLVKADPARLVEVGSDGNTIQVKQRRSVSVATLNPSGK